MGKGNVNYAIVRLKSEEDRTVFAEVYSLEVEDVEGTYTAIRSLELDWPASISPALSKAFGLTKVEADVCEMIFAYRDLAVVARHRSVALGTVRMQVKSILRKVEVPSKAELVRLLVQPYARAASTRAKTDLGWADPLGNEAIFKRRNGCKLAHT